MIKLNVFLILILGLSAHSIAQVANIDAGNLKQYIDGFGASTAWHGQLTEDIKRRLFLSVVRRDPFGAVWFICRDKKTSIITMKQLYSNQAIHGMES